ncbi:MAG TPA: GGDEF domain-containing protein, partial [Myxococcales bacterium]|nr:GGDEF domain-containing protein [Myxococcales bacterium]
NLYDSATRDGLTRLYNKKYFIDTLRKEFAYCLRHRVALSLIMLDIDHFKRINDTYGHQAGDYVLGKLAARITEHVRTEDLLARYGGEEFAVLLRETHEDKAFILAERLRRMIEATDFTYSGQQIKVTFSGGIATLYDADYSDFEQFLEAADKHLYRAKQAGRNRIEAKMLG